MEEGDKAYLELVELLKNMGHSAQEVDRIMKRLQKYEKEQQLDSIMDSIGAGSINLESLINEALR
jgi:hypothetical protein